MSATVKVCGMDVAPTQFETIYEGIHYAFCSEQCRQRFATIPHLYIGVPSEKAPKQIGAELLKRRRFQLDTPLAPHDAVILIDELGTMMGVKAIEIQDGNTVTITYALLQATADQLEAKMVEVGVKLDEGWAERLSAASFISWRTARWETWKCIHLDALPLELA